MPTGHTYTKDRPAIAPPAAAETGITRGIAPDIDDGTGEHDPPRF
jgi:hypothetical protein